MNESRITRPRLLCSGVRRWEARFGQASGCTRLTSLHLKRCSDCAEFFTLDLDFEQNLRDDAACSRIQFADTEMELRILKAVSESRAKPRLHAPRGSVFAWNQPAFASVCVAAALAFVFWFRPQPNQPGAAILENEPATEALAMWQELKIAGAELKLVNKNPLRQEIEFVRSDSRAFLGFLTLNFLPPKTQAEDSSPQS